MHLGDRLLPFHLTYCQSKPLPPGRRPVGLWRPGQQALAGWPIQIPTGFLLEISVFEVSTNNKFKVAMQFLSPEPCLFPSLTPFHCLTTSWWGVLVAF